MLTEDSIESFSFAEEDTRLILAELYFGEETTCYSTKSKQDEVKN